MSAHIHYAERFDPDAAQFLCLFGSMHVKVRPTTMELIGTQTGTTALSLLEVVYAVLRVSIMLMTSTTDSPLGTMQVIEMIVLVVWVVLVLMVLYALIANRPAYLLPYLLVQVSAGITVARVTVAHARRCSSSASCSAGRYSASLSSSTRAARCAPSSATPPPTSRFPSRP